MKYSMKISSVFFFIFIQILKECEIDIIRGPSPENPDFLLVSRIEILQVEAKNLIFVLTIRRNKSLTIENYD